MDGALFADVRTCSKIVYLSIVLSILPAELMRQLQFVIDFNLFQSISNFSVFSGDSSILPKEKEAKITSGGSTGAKVVIILLAIVAVGLFSFFLFKLWQRKKREEQYARLLKLFEEDDELEVELGLRD